MTQTRIVNIDDEKRIIDVETGEQLELDFGERYADTCLKESSKAIDKLLQAFSSLGISEDMCNRVMNLLATECESITYHEQKK